jgi:hypothetical protein
MHTCALIVARVPPVELRRVIEDCSILTEHSLKRVAAYRSHNDRSPLNINEDRSEMRGIKPGWYAMDDAGKLKSGPFSSHEEYLSRITQPTYESSPSHLRPRLS